MNETFQCTFCGTMQRTSTFQKNNSVTRLLLDARTRSDTVAHGRTSLQMVGHHGTDILLENRRTQSNTVVHACTFDGRRSHKIYFYRTRLHRRPHTVAHTSAHGRRKFTFTVHGRADERTRSHKKSSAASYPLLRTQAAKKIVSSLVTFLHCTKKEDSICSWVEFLYATLAINSCHLYSYFVECFPGVKHLKST